MPAKQRKTIAQRNIFQKLPCKTIRGCKHIVHYHVINSCDSCASSSSTWLYGKSSLLLGKSSNSMRHLARWRCRRDVSCFKLKQINIQHLQPESIVKNETLHLSKIFEYISPWKSHRIPVLGARAVANVSPGLRLGSWQLHHLAECWGDHLGVFLKWRVSQNGWFISEIPIRMEVPPNHPHVIGFSVINHPFFFDQSMWGFPKMGGRAKWMVYKQNSN